MARYEGVTQDFIDFAEPAGLIAYLASDEAAGITGVVVPIDHGITC